MAEKSHEMIYRRAVARICLEFRRCVVGKADGIDDRAAQNSPALTSHNWRTTWWTFELEGRSS
jgi:hypothetical protein